MHIMENKSNGDLEVIVKPVNHALNVAEIEREMEGLEIDGCCEAGYNVDGTFQPCNDGILCENTRMDGSAFVPEFYCAAERFYKLKRQKETLENIQPTLHFYWHMKGKSDAQDFLKQAGLLISYQ